MENELILNALKNDQRFFLNILCPPTQNSNVVYIQEKNKIRDDVLINEYGDVYLSNWKLGIDPMYWTLIETDKGYILIPK